VGPLPPEEDTLGAQSLPFALAAVGSTVYQAVHWEAGFDQSGNGSPRNEDRDPKFRRQILNSAAGDFNHGELLATAYRVTSARSQFDIVF
jgi:hypothetical protein